MIPILLKLATAAGLFGLNFAGLFLAEYFCTMVFLDSVGTAMAGMAFGPWYGAFIGLFTNVIIGAAWHRFRPFLWFAPINSLCGLVWGYIAIYFPVPAGSDIQLILYILVVGAVVGMLTALYSVPIRIWVLHFDSTHMLDIVGKKFYDPDVNGKSKLPTTGNKLAAVIKILSAEYLLGHFLDKAISTTVAVLFVLLLQQQAAQHSFDPKPMYHDLMELLGAYYYVAMGFAFKTLGVRLGQDELVTLLGPLGFFGLLIALPVIVSSLVYLMS